MPDSELNRLVGELTAEVRGLRRDVQEDRKISADYRQGMREEIANLVLRTTHLETDLMAVKKQSDAAAEVTDKIKIMKERAIGAGTLGRWLLAAGSGVLGAAGGAAAVYTWLTGRPPP